MSLLLSVSPVLSKPGKENPVIGRCGKCGVELRGTMWFSCSNRQCPSGLGQTVFL